MSIKALERLIKVANTLDKLGMHEYANQIDLIILAGGQRSRAVDDFIITLKRAYENVAKHANVMPTINDKSLPEILRVIDILAEHGNFTGPDVSAETVKGLEDESNTAVESMMELERSISELSSAIDTEKDPMKKQELQRNLEHNRKKLGEIQATVDTWRNGRRKGDTEKYQRWEKLWKERKNKMAF